MSTAAKAVISVITCLYGCSRFIVLHFRVGDRLETNLLRNRLTPHVAVGGENGRTGLNLLHYANGRVVNLGAKTAVDVGPGVSY